MATATELTRAEIAALEAEPVDQRRISETLVDGGYGRFTVRSKATQRHVTLILSAKATTADGRTISRATNAGRVGIADADVIYIDTAEGDYIGKVVQPTRGRKVITGRAPDPNVLWAASALIATAFGEKDITEQADVMLAAICRRCHRELRHPESIALGIGPECAGRRTKGRRAANPDAPKQAAPAPSTPCDACGSDPHREGCARAEFGF